jgi:hypothetical protein
MTDRGRRFVMGFGAGMELGDRISDDAFPCPHCTATIPREQPIERGDVEAGFHFERFRCRYCDTPLVFFTVDSAWTPAPTEDR